MTLTRLHARIKNVFLSSVHFLHFTFFTFVGPLDSRYNDEKEYPFGFPRTLFLVSDVMKPIFYTIFFLLTLISQSHEHYHFTRAHVSVGVYNISCTKLTNTSKEVCIRTNVTRFSVKDKNGEEASATHIAYYDIIVRASFCYLLSISKLAYFTCLTFKIIQKSVDFYRHSSSSSRQLKLKHHHHLFLLFRFLFILIFFPPIVRRNLREKSERR